MAKFKQEVLDQMKSDPELFIKVTNALGIKATSMHMTIERNGKMLNQYSMVTLVAEHLGKNPEEILEQEPEPEVKQDSAA